MPWPNGTKVTTTFSLDSDEAAVLAGALEVLRERLAERPPLAPKAHESFVIASRLSNRLRAARRRLDDNV